jgi:hypothetical protein
MVAGAEKRHFFYFIFFISVRVTAGFTGLETHKAGRQVATE